LSVDPTEQPDEQIVARILNGELDLFEVLYLRYYSKAFRLAFGMTGQRDEAEDLAQDILARLYRSLRGFRAESSFATWFYRIAINYCLNYRRSAKASTRNTVGLDEISIPPVSTGAPADDEVYEHEIQREVQQALFSLPREMRALVIMKEIEGLSYEQLAEKFQCRKGTIGSRLKRARDFLAKKLDHLK
jgi:RNA polymerase sigma-70 factor (ECF subfamily)